ncbi:MAG: DUF3078 domain-containing protein [Muribaculaceae bacterium]|nr:DUF3078 domain-containing protein [Muribaculaceae bacterium]
MNQSILKTVVTTLFTTLVSFVASAQAMYFSNARVGDPVAPASAEADTAALYIPGLTLELRPDSVRSIEEIDAFLASIDTVPYDTLVVLKPLPDAFFTPMVFTTYRSPQPRKLMERDFSGAPEMRWIEEQIAQRKIMSDLQYNLYTRYPDRVQYNINLLPEAPKEFHAVVNPEDHTIQIVEGPIEVPVAPTVAATQVKKRHWIRTFNASLQFSQAYVSPNWYQGGNNNLNMLANIYYNVKLNQEYHPNLLFETTAQYKLGMNSAPDDSVHNYSISDDLFQVNSTFGLKAAKRWYYSLTAQFKTQLLNSYESNSKNLRSAFLSPAELTVGVGMTYNYTNPKKTVTFDASIAPLSYNLKTCINDRIDPTLYNIEAGRKTSHNFGSSAELKLMWKITYNIVYTSRLFGFTDYDTAQADWEHKIAFEINRFLTTQLYAHLRYDSSTPPCDSEKWKKFQVKEILSIGFAYKFSSI